VTNETASAETVRAPAAASRSDLSLRLRIVSGSVLGVVALAGVALGGGAFAALVALVCVAMAFEWTRMIEGRAFSPAFAALASGGAAAVVLAAAGRPGVAGAAIIAAALAAFAAAAGRGIGKAVWAGGGAFYLAAPGAALVWLRDAPEAGLSLTLLLFSVVWATDTGAFFAGSLIRGPRFSPDISPAKTWSGLAGGAAAGGAAAVAAGAMLFGARDHHFFLLLGLALALATELGDMVESAIKRRFGVKDASGLIPGHGGVLDRLDGMIFATAAMAGVVAALAAVQGT